MVSLTAIVPATNDPPPWAICTDAIRLAADGPEELIVVRDADRTGPAAARNAGAREASGDVLVFVDADIEIHPGRVQPDPSRFSADPGLAALFGSYDDSPEAEGVVSVFRNLLHHHVHHAAAGPATTFWGGIGAVRRDAFERVGGFDQERFAEPSVEDIELGMRLTAAGAHIVLDPAVQGKHLKRWTLDQMIRTDLFGAGSPGSSSCSSPGTGQPPSTWAGVTGWHTGRARRLRRDRRAPAARGGGVAGSARDPQPLVLLVAREAPRWARGRRRRRPTLAAPPDGGSSVPAAVVRHALRRAGTR